MTSGVIKKRKKKPQKIGCTPLLPYKPYEMIQDKNSRFYEHTYFEYDVKVDEDSEKLRQGRKQKYEELFNSIAKTAYMGNERNSKKTLGLTEFKNVLKEMRKNMTETE